jgi:TonB family protein
MSVTRGILGAALLCILAGCGTEPAQQDGVPALPRGACVLSPAVKVAPQIDHPRIAQSAGYVILRTDVLADGSPVNVSTYASAPGRLYDDTARQMLEHTRFRPSDTGHVGCYMTYRFKPGDEF